MKNRALFSKILAGSLGLVLLTATSVISFYIGFFASSFEINLCYGKVIKEIRTKAGKATYTEEIVEFIDSLPLHGYESVCKEIHEDAAVKNGQKSS